MSVMAWTFSACSEDTLSDNFGNSPAVPGQGVYFAKSLSTSVKLAGQSGEFELPIQRTVTEGDATVKLSTEMAQEAKAVLTIPSSVSFKNGEKETKLKISYQNAVQGNPYILKIIFEDGTEYANSTQTFAVEYPFPEVWEPVTKEAVYIDQLFSAFGGGDILINGIEVEKLKDKNVYRFRSPYDNAYFKKYWGESNLFPENFEYPWIIVNGEKYTQPAEDGGTVAMENSKWFIPTTKLGFYIENGVGLAYDPSWVTFGSVPYNLTDDDSKYPLGTFNKKKQMFDLGSCFNNIKPADIGPQPAEGFQLWLDPTKMEIVYDRDFVWNPAPEKTGTFISGVQNDKWIQEIDEAVVEPGEDPLYRLTSLYAPDVNIVFYHNITKGTIRMPKKQKTGMSSFGNEVYVDMKKGSYNEETKAYTFELSFYLLDASGTKTELIVTQEKFVVGYKPKIDDYVGEWKASVWGEKDPVSISVSLTKKDNETLTLKGLVGNPNYNDAIDMAFNQNDGTLIWRAQNLPNYGPYEVLATPWVSGKAFATEDALIGWLNEEGKIVFLNATTNKYPVDSYVLAAFDEEGFAGPLVELASLTLERGLMEKPKAKISFASPIRTYNTKLQYKPTATVKAEKVLKSAFIGKKVTVPFRAID